MNKLPTYYTPEKERTYDADEVDAMMVEVEEIIVDVEDIFRVVCEVLSDNSLPREEYVECFESLAPRMRRLLKSALLRVQEEARV